MVICFLRRLTQTITTWYVLKIGLSTIYVDANEEDGGVDDGDDDGYDVDYNSCFHHIKNGNNYQLIT